MSFASIAMRAFGFVCQVWIAAISLLILYSIWGTLQMAAQVPGLGQTLMMAAVGIGIDLVLWFGLIILPVGFLYFSGISFIPLIGRRREVDPSQHVVHESAVDRAEEPPQDEPRAERR